MVATTKNGRSGSFDLLRPVFINVNERGLYENVACANSQI
jgi:hypothetical protein